jgi:hypothetical protein
VLPLVGLTALGSTVPTFLSRTGAALASAKSPRTLFLAETAISDEGLKHLAGLTDLVGLELDHTAVTDAGLQ